MMISEIESIRLTYKYREDEIWGWPGGTYRGWTGAFIKITDETGVYGIGEIGDGLNIPEVIPDIINKFHPMLVGQDPRMVRSIKNRVYRSMPGWGRRGLGISILSGIEMALFDLIGKIYQIPAHVLLGGALRQRIPVYASGGVDTTLDALISELKTYSEIGFDAVKIRIGFGVEKDIERVDAARSALGKKMKLLLDYGGSYLPEPPELINVLQLTRKLEPYNPYWLEEPLHPDNIQGHRILRKSTPIPIAAGENSRTIYEIKQFLDAEAIDIIQTDAVYSGGMIEQIEIANLAAHYGVSVAPHTWGSAPGLMANLHAVACMPNAIIAEYSQALNPLRDKILIKPLEFIDGEVILPDLPGLGVDISKETLDMFPYDSSASVILKVG